MFVRQKKLPTAKTVKRLVPLTSKQIAIKKVLDEQLATNFSTREKLVVVCGPCSADNPNAVKEYLQKLAAIKNRHPDLLVVARVYTTKPHTDGTGYHGLAFGDNGVSMDGGIVAARQLMRDALDLGLPVADELLYPELYRRCILLVFGRSQFGRRIASCVCLIVGCVRRSQKFHRRVRSSGSCFAVCGQSPGCISV